MKKRIIISILFVLIFASTKINASTFSNNLPGGKNYLEPANFEINQDTLTTIDEIYVKENQTYTISFIGEGLIERPEINVYSSSYTYMNDLASDITTCSVSMEYTECTFTTQPNENFINIEIYGDGLDLFYIHYDMDHFQLEEGSVRTTFEEYIIPFIDSSSPEFTGSGAFITSYSNNYSIQYIIDNHIVVIDDIDGDITDLIEIVSDEYTPNMTKTGEYQVNLRATDSSDNNAYFTLTVIVKDEDAPLIVGPDELIISSNSTSTIEHLIESNYTVTDGHDSNLSIEIITDNYSINKSILGSYQVLISITDSSMNQTTKSIMVSVIDDQAPQLVSSQEITINHSNPKTLDSIINYLNVTDNHTQSEMITKQVLNETYTTADNIPGIYNASLKLIDEANNEVTVELIITIVDDINPTITGPDTYSFSYTNPQTISDFLDLFVVSDNHDLLNKEDITIINDTYTNRSSQVGVFSITFEVADNSNNKATHLLEISIVDDQAPIIYIDNVLITLSENVTFNQQDALKLLINNKELPNKNFEIVIINDEYSGNENKPGRYLYSLEFQDEDGFSLQKDFIIEVPEDNTLVFTDLLIRNIIVYSLAGLFLLVSILKKKK